MFRYLSVAAAAALAFAAAPAAAENANTIIPVVNLPCGASCPITLDGPTLAGIYQGKIIEWDDAAIALLNPNVTLPHMGIVVIHRSDDAGITRNFTAYLSANSESWKKAIGSGTTVTWPLGLGGTDDSGVGEYVGSINGAIGYVTSGYENQKQLAAVTLSEPLQSRFLVFFDFTEVNLTEAATDVAKAAADSFFLLQASRIDIAGHADGAEADPAAWHQTVKEEAKDCKTRRDMHLELPCRWKEPDALKVGMMRAQATADILEMYGVPKAAIHVSSAGAEDPLVQTPKGKREPQNRFANITIQ